MTDNDFSPDRRFFRSVSDWADLALAVLRAAESGRGYGRCPNCGAAVGHFPACMAQELLRHFRAGGDVAGA